MPCIEKNVWEPPPALAFICKLFGNSLISPTRSGTTEIYFFGPAGAGIQNKICICNIHPLDIVLQLQLDVQVFLVLQKNLEYQKQWNCTKLSEIDTDMQNNIVRSSGKGSGKDRQGQVTKRSPKTTERP